MASVSLARSRHVTDVSPRKSDLWKEGRKQATISLERYHYLCAAIQHAYGRDDYNKTVEFDTYMAYKLPPVGGVKLHPLPNGTIHPEDIKIYVERFENNWRCREGGILYCIGEGREWWNMVLNYHATDSTTGREGWDLLFALLKANGYSKGLIPCMYFAQVSGCLDPQCPFSHHEEECRKERQKFLWDRRRR
ncbi:hypothetical protein BV25DRAFT_1920849 [Artomyces pyxidatus]|uniref:Uncharacterized protein n=1 Tax=Artomyces pyxidatus TaxID=48021 RepID=A0ACB8SL50_9AGAM|nr:hypothetical protein BV25DRAFT_1920849 [Artomyces pyxidatus]